MMGCTTPPQKSQLPTKAEPAQQSIACNESSDIPDGYPWSIPGQHKSAHPLHSFGVTQVRGNPNQFTFCVDCPCPTAKNQTKSDIASTKKRATDRLRKVVINFESAAYQLSEEQRATLKRLYQSLPNEYHLTVTGYTDDVASGGTVTNKSLAKQRASAVLGQLIALGVGKQDTTLKSSPLCCYVAPNTTDSGRALNRRTEIVISTSFNPKSNKQ